MGESNLPNTKCRGAALKTDQTGGLALQYAKALMRFLFKTTPAICIIVTELFNVLFQRPERFG